VVLFEKDVSSPVEYAFGLWNRYVSQTKQEYRSKTGQYATPPEVARYMASLVPSGLREMRLLDPGAGTGILTSAYAEYASRNEGLEHLIVDLYETENLIVDYLDDSMRFLRDWLSARGVSIDYRIIDEDFLIRNGALFADHSQGVLVDEEIEKYSSVIMNPPYFKLNKSDTRARVASSIVHGQPNIYFLFLMLGALLLREDGVLVSISPRSFTSGLYFKAFRARFFDLMHPSSIHLFTSRTETFKHSDVLQETLILKAERKSLQTTTVITTSNGSIDLTSPTRLEVVTDEILRESDGRILFVPTSEEELALMKKIESWPETISSLGLRVSTGPVVPFRATEYLRKEPGENTVPLLWMHNIQLMEVNWPLDISKPQHIEDSATSHRLLVSNQPYVLIHRFSAKEQSRRFVAAPLNPTSFDFDWIGIENHVNYLHKPKGRLSYSECVGISALLCTRTLDSYIRIKSGNTQVNASDMMNLPLPPLDTIQLLGEEIMAAEHVDLDSMEEYVLSQLDLSEL